MIHKSKKCVFFYIHFSEFFVQIYLQSVMVFTVNNLMYIVLFDMINVKRKLPVDRTSLVILTNSTVIFCYAVIYYRNLF